MPWIIQNVDFNYFDLWSLLHLFFPSPPLPLTFSSPLLPLFPSSSPPRPLFFFSTHRQRGRSFIRASGTSPARPRASKGVHPSASIDSISGQRPSSVGAELPASRLPTSAKLRRRRRTQSNDSRFIGRKRRNFRVWRTRASRIHRQSRGGDGKGAGPEKKGGDGWLELF